ncbi:MAG: HipA domain-containing protein [Sphingobacteriaceae bacterium]|nr:HipA domain-containing protein [Sphingobacteriaceae bacterium]
MLNIFKIGTSAAGARLKIWIAESKLDGSMVPGDIHFSDDHEHYLVKLNLDDEGPYNSEMMEYAYYLTARHCGISMMDSKLIDHRHFATKRFDRMAGEKIHVLTASGITGWDFKDPSNASYENLFELALFLKLPHAQIEELFRRMVFNLVFANNDDHLKNHSFLYDRHNDRWQLSPAYDLTYSLNPLVNFKKTSRALAINHKRIDIGLADVKLIAQKYTVRNYLGIMEEVQSGMAFWQHCTKDLGVPLKIRERIARVFVVLK